MPHFIGNLKVEIEKEIFISSTSYIFTRKWIFSSKDKNIGSPGFGLGHLTGTEYPNRIRPEIDRFSPVLVIVYLTDG